jgi:hypothetical protein
MGFSKRVLIAASGLVLAGGASLTMGTTNAVSAAAVTAGPQTLFRHDGCCASGSRLSDRLSGRSFNVNHHSQRMIINNRTIVNNISTSDSDAKQRQRLENSPATSAASSSSAAGGGGGGGGGGGDTG